ncbi:MAG: TolB family protein [Bacillota bacterium]
MVRTDGAWLWQIQLPAPPPPPPEPPAPGKPLPPPPPPPPPPTIVGSPQWTPQSTLLFQDSSGTWQEAHPAGARLMALPPALQGTVGLAISPDGQQVLYYKGSQLFTARRDGSQPRLVGAGLIGSWAPDGTLQTAKAPPPGLAPQAEPQGLERE